MNYFIKATFLWCLILSTAGYACSEKNTVRIAVAANFSTTLDLLVPPFTQETTYCVKKSVGSTVSLYNNIINGAPFDLFLAADAKHPSLLVEQGLAMHLTTYAVGQLILMGSLQQKVISDHFFKKNRIILAISDPALTPYGFAAKQVLLHLKVWQKVKTNLIRANDVSQVFTYLKQGGADAAFISRAQLNYLQQQGELHYPYWLVPTDLYQPIIQQAVLLKKSSDNKAALAFLNYLQSDSAKKIINHAGYHDA